MYVKTFMPAEMLHPQAAFYSAAPRSQINRLAYDIEAQTSTVDPWSRDRLTCDPQSHESYHVTMPLQMSVPEMAY